MITTKGVLGRQASLVTVPSDNHTLTVEHIRNVPRVLDNCGTVVSKHVLPIADTKKQRRTFSRPDEEIWIVLEHEHDTTCAFNDSQSTRSDLTPRSTWHRGSHVLDEVSQPPSSMLCNAEMPHTCVLSENESKASKTTRRRRPKRWLEPHSAL
jgi:hypothetical protein